MMKHIWLCLVLIIGSFSCTVELENTELEDNQNFDVQKYLASFDSVKCWTTQFQSYENKTTGESWGIDVVYLGVYFVGPDSVYHFSYPCDLWNTTAYCIYGDELLMTGFSSRQFYFNRDTIELTYEERRKSPSGDSITVRITEIYAKQKVKAPVLLNLIQIKHNEACDTVHGLINLSELKHFESLMDGMDKVAF